MTITEDETDRRLLEQQEQERLKKVGSSGGNGHDKEESETPIADEEIQQYKDQPKEKEGKGKDNKPREKYVIPTYKYSKLGKGDLYESIILGGIPSFIRYDEKNNKLVPYQQIEEETRILRPPSAEEYPYTPYEFESIEELDKYLEYAKSQSMDTLFRLALNFIKKYNDQDEHKLILLAVDAVWSYVQDKFGTTHYLGIVGDNDSGKSSIGNTLEKLLYRAVNMTSPTAPNIFRVLGMIEAGQCTLILDEADKIDDSIDMLNILKTGYDNGKKVPKTNTNSWKQEWFWTYCLKVMIAEKSPSKLKAKGLLDRTLSFTVYPGIPQLDIKEVTSPQGDSIRSKEYDRLMDFRKLMLVYRLIHFKDKIPDIDINVQRRNKELCKPYIQLFYNTPVQQEIEKTFQIFLDSKNSKKARSIEAILIPVIIDLVEQEGEIVSSKRVWEFIKQNIEGEAFGSDEYHIADHTLYRTTITKLLEDKFGAEVEHARKGNKVIFKPEKLQRIQKSYDIDVNIKTTLKCEGSEGSEGSRENAPLPVGENTDKTVENSGKEKEDNVHISRNQGIETSEIPNAFPQEPSHPSHPSPSFQYKCYHCDNFQTNNRDFYEHHGSREHFTKPIFPTKTEIEKYGLKPQGKEWEV